YFLLGEVNSCPLWRDNKDVPSDTMILGLETEMKSSDNVAGISENVLANLVFETNDYCDNLAEIYQKTTEMSKEIDIVLVMGHLICGNGPRGKRRAIQTAKLKRCLVHQLASLVTRVNIHQLVHLVIIIDELCTIWLKETHESDVQELEVQNETGNVKYRKWMNVLKCGLNAEILLTIDFLVALQKGVFGRRFQLTLGVFVFSDGQTDHGQTDQESEDEIQRYSL
ncbi:hypothetical protein Tco_0953315, partial [Tanacetum coccineum]